MATLPHMGHQSALTIADRWRALRRDALINCRLNFNDASRAAQFLQSEMETAPYNRIMLCSIYTIEVASQYSNVRGVQYKFCGLGIGMTCLEVAYLLLLLVSISMNIALLTNNNSYTMKYLNNFKVGSEDRSPERPVYTKS